jgi:hypothetical protein
MFQDLNNVYFIFYEKTKNNKNCDVNSITKKIYLDIISNNKDNKRDNKRYKKTIKKQYKA